MLSPSIIKHYAMQAYGEVEA